MKFKNRYLFLIVVIFAVINGCSSKTIKHQNIAKESQAVKVKKSNTKKNKLYSKVDRISPKAFHYFVNGTIYEEIGDFNSAATSYKQALQIYPNSYEIRFSMSDVYYQMQKFNDVLDILETIQPEDLFVLERRAHCYRSLGLDNQAKRAYLNVIALDSTDAMSYSYLASYYRRELKDDSLIWTYENLTKLRPNNYRLWGELGKLYIQNDSLERAKKALSESIRLSKDKSNLMTIIRLGELYEMEEKWDSALALYQIGYSIEEDNILVNRMLSNYYVQVDSIYKAIPYARKIVNVTPKDLNAIRRLGSIYFGSDSLNSADSIFTTLVEMGDHSPINYFYLGRIEMSNSNYHVALKHFKNLTLFADTSAESWLDLGFAYRKLNDPNNEIETYITGINHMPNEKSGVQLLFTLGATYEYYDRYDDAVKVFEEIIAKIPDHDQALNYLGYMLADRGERLDYAKELIEKALSFEPENVAYLDSYGWVFYKLGDNEKALKYLKKAATLDNDPLIFDHLGDAYKANGDIESARTAWKKALNFAPDDSKIKEKLER